MKDDFRLSPDELLLKSAEENAAKKGRLKIFFGYAAGVGKDPAPCTRLATT